MGQTNLSDYKNLYLQTAKEYVGNLSSSYSKLLANSQNSEAIDSIHLDAHSLKGQSQVMGFTNIVNSCMNIDKIYSDIKDGKNKIDNTFLNLLKGFIDDLNSEIILIEKGNIV